MKELKYENDKLNSLPDVPYSMFYYDTQTGYLRRPKLYTVSEKRINPATLDIEIYVVELGKFISYDYHTTPFVKLYHPN